MNLSYRKHFLSLAIAAAVGVIVNTEHIQAAGRVDITALLKFAEQYNAGNGNDLPPPATLQSHEKKIFTHQKATKVKRPNKINQSAELKKKDAEVTRLQRQIAMLENRLHNVNVPLQETYFTAVLLSQAQLDNLGNIIGTFKQVLTVGRQQLCETKDNTQQKLNEITTSYDREITNLKHEKSKIEEQIAAVIQEKQQLQQELSELTQQLSGTSLRQNEIVTQLQSEQEKIESEFHRQMTLLMQSQVAMQTQLMTAGQDKEKLQQEIVELTQKLELVNVQQDLGNKRLEPSQEEMQTALNQQLLLITQEKSALQSQLNKAIEEKRLLEQQSTDLVRKLEASVSEQHLTIEQFNKRQQQMQADFDAALKDEKLTLQTQIDLINQEKQKLKEEIQAQTKKQEEILANHEKTIAEYAAESSQYDALKKKLHEQAEQYKLLERQFVSLTAVYPTIQNDILNKDDVRLDYAAGVTLGQDILAIQAEQKKWGLKSNEQVILSGILDVFSDQVRLDEQTLRQIMAVSEKQISEAREKFVHAQAKMGGEYIAKFRQQSGVKESELGFLYLIDYPGDDLIPDKATIDIVINESLANGTVIKDMEAQGIVLSHRVEEFPPLFAHAIKLLRNHGSMTMVVPPELAYGKEGYQPHIPPDATMVYHIRIADAYVVDK